MPMPLDGLRMVDLTENLAGPFCSMLLADMGVDTIKIERPETGDNTRGWGKPRDTISRSFTMVNRNKRCIVVDLKDERGRTIVVAVWRNGQTSSGKSPARLHGVARPRLRISREHNPARSTRRSPDSVRRDLSRARRTGPDRAGDERPDERDRRARRRTEQSWLSGCRSGHGHVRRLRHPLRARRRDTCRGLDRRSTARCSRPAWRSQSGKRPNSSIPVSCRSAWAPPTR